jgi:acyl-CoA reductase-like NAD-dependent aldehyde dehydrogenase
VLLLRTQAASKDWAALSILERADWLDKIADALEARKEEIAQLESKDTGKPLKLAVSSHRLHVVRLIGFDVCSDSPDCC